MENTKANTEAIQEQAPVGWIEQMRMDAHKAALESQKFIKFEDGEVKELEIKYDPYNRWRVEKNKFGKDSVYIPCMEKGIERDWNLALSNPMVEKILSTVQAGLVKIKVRRTGIGADTKYEIVE